MAHSQPYILKKQGSNTYLGRTVRFGSTCEDIEDLKIAAERLSDF